MSQLLANAVGRVTTRRQAAAGMSVFQRFAQGGHDAACVPKSKPTIVAAVHDSSKGPTSPTPASVKKTTGKRRKADKSSVKAEENAGLEGVADSKEGAADLAELEASASTRKRPKKSLPKARVPSALVQQASVRSKAERIGNELDALYPEPAIPLAHATPFQLLVSVMLSAQTTDKKVNAVTPNLFALASDAAAMAKLEPPVVEEIIREVGLAPTKSKNVCAMAKALLEEHGGQVPDTVQQLEQLPGVGHKTAAVVVAQAFGQPAFPVDTHIHRLAQRWGLTPAGGTVEQTEADLCALWEPQTWIRRHLQIIYFGREQCAAQRHDPSSCCICSFAAVPPFDKAGVSPPRAGQKGARQ